MWVVGFSIFIFLHEAGHAFAAQLVGVPVKSVVVWLLGGFTNLAYKPEKPAHNLFIYAAGPLMNMLLAFACVAIYIVSALVFLPASGDAALYVWLQTFQNLFFSLAVLNLILIVFNLIPIYPLDGGNILHAGMEMLFGKSAADRVTLIIGVPFLLLLIALGLFTRDYILLFFCILIAVSLSALNRSLLKQVNLGLTYLFKRAAYHYLRGDYERAVQMYTAEIERQPENINNYIARGGCYIVMGQKERAAADIDRALRINPGNIIAIALRGEIHLLDKQYDAALDRFAQAQALNPNWPVPHFDRASLQLERGEYQAALQGFNKAVSLLSRMPFFYLVRSLAHFRLGDLKSAHEDQDLAVALSPEESLVMVDVNLTLYEDNLDWAKDYYGRILDKNPRHALALHGFADAFLVNHDFDSAVSLYSRAIEVNSKEARLYLGRGKAYKEKRNLENAKQDFEMVLKTTDKLHLRRQAEEFIRKINSAM
jgi:tetratricopeptide (TPR) repeat protein